MAASAASAASSSTLKLPRRDVVKIVSTEPVSTAMVHTVTEIISRLRLCAIAHMRDDYIELMRVFTSIEDRLKLNVNMSRPVLDLHSNQMVLQNRLATLVSQLLLAMECVNGDSSALEHCANTPCCTTIDVVCGRSPLLKLNVDLLLFSGKHCVKPLVHRGLIKYYKEMQYKTSREKLFAICTLVLSFAFYMCKLIFEIVRDVYTTSKLPEFSNTLDFPIEFSVEDAYNALADFVTELARDDYLVDMSICVNEEIVSYVSSMRDKFFSTFAKACKEPTQSGLKRSSQFSLASPESLGLGPSVTQSTPRRVEKKKPF